MLFISYSRQNSEIAQLLYSSLIDYGFASHQVFKDDDPRNGISLGEDWEKQLIANVKGVTVLIVLVSPAWFQSKWCFAELTMAKASPHKVKIIALIIEDLTAEQWLASGLTARQKSNVEFSSTPNSEAAIFAFLEDLQVRGIRPDNPHQRLRDSHPDSSTYKHKSYDQWGTDPNMQHTLVPDSGHQGAIDAVRANLRDRSAFHIHVHGNTGVGKSRIIFESISLDVFQPLVVYYESPDQFSLDPFISSLLRPDAADQAIVVVDDCLRVRPSDLANRLRPAIGRVKLITISFEAPDSHNEINIEIPKITSDGIQNIIASYCGPTFNATSIAQLCQGSARYAHLVGEAAKTDRSILDTQDGRDLAERIIPCGASKDSELAKSRLIVARFLSLFDRFGAAHPHADEIQAVAKVIRRFHPRIGLGDILDTVQALHNARILQGCSTYFFATPLISHQLWGAWWRMYGEHWMAAKPMSLPEYLFDAWLHQMRTVQSSEITRYAAKQILKSLTNARLGLLTHLGKRNLDDESRRQAKRNRKLTIAIGDLVHIELTSMLYRELQRASYDVNELQEAREQLQDYEQIIQAGANFDDPSTAFIELLVEVELGRASDRVADIGQSLGNTFARFQGEKRTSQFFRRYTNFVREKIEHGTDEYKYVLLMALYHSIQRTSDHTTDGEIYIDQLWKLGASGIQQNIGMTRSEDVLSQLSECLGVLFVFPNRAIEWIEALDWLAFATLENRIPILTAIETFWVHPHSFFENEFARGELKRFYNQLIEGDVSTRIEVLLLRSIRTFSSEDETKLQSLYPHTEAIEEVCKEIATSPEAKSDLIAKLIRSTNTQYLSGTRIQSHDKNGKAFQCMMHEYKSNPDTTNTSLLMGYLNSLKKSNLPLYESYFQETLSINWSNEKRLLLCANLNASSDRLAEPFIAMAKECNTNMRQFWPVTNEQVQALSEANFQEIVSSFLNCKTIRSLESATWLFHTRHPTEDALTDESRSMLERIVLSEAVFERFEPEYRRDLNMHYWEQCFELQAKSSFSICMKFVAVYWQHDTSLFQGPAIKAATKAVESCIDQHPDSTWEIFFVQLTHANAEQAVRLLDWISADHAAEIEPQAGYWGTIPIETLFSWAEEKPSFRVPLIARRIPTLLLSGGIFEPTRRFLLRYNDRFPDIETMIRNRNFGYVVPSTEQVQNALTYAWQARDAELDEGMVAILDREIQFLSSKLERTKANEELRMERDRYR